MKEDRERQIELLTTIDETLVEYTDHLNDIRQYEELPFEEMNERELHEAVLLAKGLIRQLSKLV